MKKTRSKTSCDTVPLRRQKDTARQKKKLRWSTRRSKMFNINAQNIVAEQTSSQIVQHATDNMTYYSVKYIE
jgi:hypothetical protein